jgi:hypothetical protein
MIPENFVGSNWLKLAQSISDYDHFVRGIPSKAEVRSKLRVLDTIAPLSELPDIRREMEPQGRIWQQSTPLLQAWKGMLDVPAYTSLRSGMGLSSGQIRRLSFSYMLRATISYIVHQEIFSIEENGALWQTVERCLNAGKLSKISSRSMR